MYTNDKQIMERLREHANAVNALGYEWVAVMLQGSQNYGLAYEGSDVDSKALVLPKFEDFVLNRSPASFTHVLENNEHVDIKDVRLMFQCFKKQNINFVEVLFTDYMLVNPEYSDLFQPMFDNRERIARYDNWAAMNCLAGMSMEKCKALTHPYPTIKWKIDKWGYDGKQLSHIMRVNQVMKNYVSGLSYKQCLTPYGESKVLQLRAKKNEYTLEEAMALAIEFHEDTMEMKRQYPESNPHFVDAEVEEEMNNVLLNVLKQSFRKEMMK